MSSVAAPFGFIAARHPSGCIRARPYSIASGYAANIFLNDPVKLVTAGGIQLGTSDGTRTGTVADVLLLGTFAGCTYTDSTGKPNYSPFWPSGTVSSDAIAWVYDDPDTEFLVQSNGSIAAAAIGDQADWIGFTAPGGSTLTGLSSGALSSTLIGAGDQAQFRIKQIYPAVDNAAGDSFTQVLVEIAQHQYRAGINAV